MIREPVAAGQYYPASPARLRSMIVSFVDKEAEKEDADGVLVPHAGYIYSGGVAGAVLSRIKMRDTFVIIGPNHTGRGKPFSIMAHGSWKTPLGEVRIDEELAERILEISKYLEEDLLAHEFEHSIEVQLPFLQFFRPDVRFVPVILGSGDREICRAVGRDIAEAIKDLNRDAVIMTSSDMNHYEQQKVSRRKDFQAIEAVLALDADELHKRVAEQDITMCGYAPAMVMISALGGPGAARAELVKYQTSGDVSGDYNAVVGYAGVILKKYSPLVKLAKQATESYVRDRKVFQPQELSTEMKEKAGTFVCIKKGGDLRGCIGTFEPTRSNVAEEIVANAISTATSDPRFEPVEADELKDLDYTVDVLTRPEPVSGPDQLDPKKYGVIVEAGFRRGLLLPDLEGVDTIEDQVNICRQKGGIGPREPVNLYRFEVKRYK
ncbi:MAG: AmmeMemoRadiSam system protein B [Dehalococcoidales bacterium]|nr:AmmeMemoRadiSam system protein B [Dehalococcoidales bacterium]